MAKAFARVVEQDVSHTPFTINSGTQPEQRNSGVVLGVKRCPWFCGGNYEIAQIAGGESLINKFDFIFLWYIF